MKVTVLPFLRATFLAMYLYIKSWSAMRVSVVKRMPNSTWPAVATSWWWTSIGTPAASSASTISVRTSCSVSVGGTGK